MEQKEEGYNSFKIAIPPDYANVFSHFYFAENISSKTITKILLPTYQTIFIFNFGTKALLYSKQNTQIEIDKCLVLGPIKKAFSYSLLPQSKILVANFKDDAFYRFFGNTSFSEGFALKPDELLKENCFTALWSELNKIDNPNQQVNYILEFCHPYLRPRHAIVEQLKNINDPSLNAIKAIAFTNNQTERNIQIKQKNTLGTPLKKLTVIIAF